MLPLLKSYLNSRFNYLINCCLNHENDFQRDGFIGSEQWQALFRFFQFMFPSFQAEACKRACNKVKVVVIKIHLTSPRGNIKDSIRNCFRLIKNVKYIAESVVPMGRWTLHKNVFFRRITWWHIVIFLTHYPSSHLFIWILGERTFEEYNLFYLTYTLFVLVHMRVEVWSKYHQVDACVFDRMKRSRGKLQLVLP